MLLFLVDIGIMTHAADSCNARDPGNTSACVIFIFWPTTDSDSHESIFKHIDDVRMFPVSSSKVWSNIRRE